MRDAMKGTCLTLDEYRTSHTPFSDHWQCAAAENDNFGESAYCPSERVIKSLSRYAGVSMETFSKFHLRSSNESDALYGKWCGMPAPPEYEHPYGGVVGARVFWEDHYGRFGLQGFQTGKCQVWHSPMVHIFSYHPPELKLPDFHTISHVAFERTVSCEMQGISMPWFVPLVSNCCVIKGPCSMWSLSFM